MKNPALINHAISSNTKLSINSATKWLCALSLLTLVACGGGGGGGSSTDGTDNGNGPSNDYVNGSLSARVVKGVVGNANVKVYAITNGVVEAQQMAGFDSDPNGRFDGEFSLFGELKPMALIFDSSQFNSSASITCDYFPSCSNSVDFANRENNIGISVYGFDNVAIKLKSYIGGYTEQDFVNGFNGDINISVLTTLAAAMADGMAGGATAANIQAAQENIESLLGLDVMGIDIRSTSLIDVTDQDEWLTASDKVRYHSVVNAAIIGAAKSINSDIRVAAGLDPLREDYIVLLSQVIADLENDGVLGGDTTAYAYAGNYSINVVDSRFNLNTTINSAVNNQGRFSGANLNSSIEMDELVFRVSDSSNGGKIKGSFTTSRFSRENSDSISGVVDATVDTNGNITGRVSGNFSATITGTAVFSEQTNLTPNTNADLEIDQLIRMAVEQVTAIDALYNTATTLPPL
jgi:hypothetical protein